MKEINNKISLNKLEEAIKRDIEKLKTLSIPLMSQKLMYGTILKNMKMPLLVCCGFPMLFFLVKIFLCFSGKIKASDDMIFFMPFGFFVLFFIIGYIFRYANILSMFQIAIKDKLETGRYFEKKMINMAKMAIKLYSFIFFSIFFFLYFFIGFYLVLFAPLIISFVITYGVGHFYLKMEMQRLGITVLSNEISKFFSRNGLISSKSESSGVSKGISGFGKNF